MYPERIDKLSDIRSWTDTLPLHYKYTYGVAGQKFMEGLKNAKLLGSICSKCNSKFFPAKSYCTNCFSKIERYEEVNADGLVKAIAEKDGLRYCFVVFEGYQGGMIHFASPGVKIGDRVKPVFKKAEERKGRINDIMHFEKL